MQVQCLYMCTYNTHVHIHWTIGHPPPIDLCQSLLESKIIVVLPVYYIQCVYINVEKPLLAINSVTIHVVCAFLTCKYIIYTCLPHRASFQESLTEKDDKN